MIKSIGSSIAAVFSLLTAPSAQTTPATVADPMTPAQLRAISYERVDGTKSSLADHAGRVVLVVNTASKCGLTPQYEDLEALYKEKKDAGLDIVGFPANNFKEQEPGTDTEIQEFCKLNYGVTFPVMAKVSVKGEDQCPLYAALTGERSPFPGDITWNFEKFLVSRDGQIVARFAPRTKPSDAAVRAAIEAELAKPAPQPAKPAADAPAEPKPEAAAQP